MSLTCLNPRALIIGYGGQWTGVPDAVSSHSFNEADVNQDQRTVERYLSCCDSATALAPGDRAARYSHPPWAGIDQFGLPIAIRSGNSRCRRSHFEVTSPEPPERARVFAERDSQHLRLQRRQSGQHDSTGRAAGTKRLRRDQCFDPDAPNWEVVSALALTWESPPAAPRWTRPVLTSRRGYGTNDAGLNRLSGPVPSARRPDTPLSADRVRVGRAQLEPSPNVRAAVSGSLCEHTSSLRADLSALQQPAA